MVTKEIGNAGVPGGYQTVFGTGGIPTAEDHVPELATWWQRIKVWDQMWRSDSRIAATVRAVQQPIIGARWHVRQGNASEAVTGFVADQLNLPVLGQSEQEQRTPDRVRHRFNWPAFMRHVTLSMVYGFMVFEQVYQPVADGRVGLKKLAPRLPHTLTTDGLVVAEDGGLVGVRQRVPGGSPVEIPVDRLVVFVFDQVGANWTGRSLLRPIFGDWKLKRHALEANAVFVDRNGAGVPVVIGPDMSMLEPADQVEAMKEYQAIAEQYRAGDRAGVALPYGAQLQFRGVSGTQPDLLGTVRYHDAEIAASVLAHFASLATARNGSRALGGTLVELFNDSLNATAAEFANVITAHVVEDLVDLNWGPGEPAPSVGCDEIGLNLDALVGLMGQLHGAELLRADWETEEWVRRQAGLPPKFGGTPPPPGVTSPNSLDEGEG